MVCSTMKKGLLGAALAAGALYLAFGTSAPSYVRTAFHKVRGHAHQAVPVQFEIDRAREEVRRLEGPIRDTVETFARTEVEVKWLKDEIATVETKLEREHKILAALQERANASGVKRTGGRVDGATEELNTEVFRRLDHCKYVKQILHDKESTLKAKQKIMLAAQQQYHNLNAQKRELLTKLDSIEARLQQIEASKQKNEFNFDDSTLSQAKMNVSDLEKRVEVQARISEVEGNLSEDLPLYVEPGRDVAKELQEELGSSGPSDGAKADKSL